MVQRDATRTGDVLVLPAWGQADQDALELELVMRSNRLAENLGQEPCLAHPLRVREPAGVDRRKTANKLGVDNDGQRRWVDPILDSRIAVILDLFEEKDR